MRPTKASDARRSDDEPDWQPCNPARRPLAPASSWARITDGGRARLAPVLAGLVLSQGCQHDPYAGTCTLEEPRPSDVIGLYRLTSQTLTTEGLSALQGKDCVVDLRVDGSFVASNVPPWTDLSRANLFYALVSGSGTWRIERVGSVDLGGTPKTRWGISFDSPACEIMSVGLTGAKPPHGLIFTLGDPDSGDVMRLERVGQDRPR